MKERDPILNKTTDEYHRMEGEELERYSRALALSRVSNEALMANIKAYIEWYVLDQLNGVPWHRITESHYQAHLSLARERGLIT